MGDIKGRALVRIDVNVPVRNGKIVANNLRFKAISKKINSYSENGIAPVIVSHQGRKGDDDYLESLEQHKEVFQKLLPQIEFFYSNNLDGTELKSKMLSLKQGQALVVKNIRDHEDEKKTFKNADERKNSEMVKFFSPLVDLYINDAPATMHRGDTSLTAFRHALPSFLGLQMEEELKVLHGPSSASSNPSP